MLLRCRLATTTLKKASCQVRELLQVTRNETSAEAIGLFIPLIAYSAFGKAATKRRLITRQSTSHSTNAIFVHFLTPKNRYSDKLTTLYAAPDQPRCRDSKARRHSVMKSFICRANGQRSNAGKHSSRTLNDKHWTRREKPSRDQEFIIERAKMR